MLSDTILQFLTSNYGGHQYQLWVYLFFNKRGLMDTFGRVGSWLTKTKFEDFCMGFNEAAERFLMVDVGSRKEAADAKIKGKSSLAPPSYVLKRKIVQHTLKLKFFSPKPIRLSLVVSFISCFPCLL